jgi:hypothetical protein
MMLSPLPLPLPSMLGLIISILLFSSSSPSSLLAAVTASSFYDNPEQDPLPNPKPGSGSPLVEELEQKWSVDVSRTRCHTISLPLAIDSHVLYIVGLQRHLNIRPSQAHPVPDSAIRAV